MGRKNNCYFYYLLSALRWVVTSRRRVSVFCTFPLIFSFYFTIRTAQTFSQFFFSSALLTCLQSHATLKHFLSFPPFLLRLSSPASCTILILFPIRATLRCPAHQSLAICWGKRKWRYVGNRKCRCRAQVDARRGGEQLLNALTA